MTFEIATLLQKIDQDLEPTKQIYSTMRSAIVNMDLVPGTLVSEAEIATAVGASRTPVRAALAQLRDEGLIATRPSRGNYVTLLSASTARDAQFIRDALERAALIRIGETGLSEEYRLKFAQNLERAAMSITENDRTAFHELDDEFHSLIAQATGLERLSWVLGREKSQLVRLRVLSLNDSSFLQTLLQEHQAIFDAILAGEMDSALGHLSAHLSRVLRTLNDLEAQHSDFFKRDTQ